MKAEINLRLARECVQACARAYEDSSFSSPLAQVLIEKAEIGKAESRNQESGNPKRMTIIAFRGSARDRDWLTDFRIGFTRTEFGGVHTGFWQSTSSVFWEIMRVPEIMAAVPVILTGHSKGAAEALICARMLRGAGKPVAAVVTFGGPRVGDARWRRQYNQVLGEVTFRWVHEEDIVPRLPVWISGYRHVGQECFMSSFGGVELDPPVWRMAASDIWGTFWGYKAGHIEQLADHPVQKYVEHLGQL